VGWQRRRYFVAEQQAGGLEVGGAGGRRRGGAEGGREGGASGSGQGLARGTARGAACRSGVGVGERGGGVATAALGRKLHPCRRPAVGWGGVGWGHGGGRGSLPGAPGVASKPRLDNKSSNYILICSN
jgi:hypothetical protein